MHFKDQLQRSIHLNQRPERIVSLVPSQTELLVYLGLQDQLVGLTKFCVHPKDLKQSKTIVGGTKNVKLDKIAALQPDVILCNKEENTQEMISDLEQIAPVHISNINNLQDCYELIEMYGNIFQRDHIADNLVKAIELSRLQFHEKSIQNQTIKVAYFIWRDPWMVAGRDTFIDHMIAEAGYSNVFRSYSRYPEIDLHDPVLKSVDQILLSSEPYPFKAKHIQELKNQFPNKEVLLVDGEMFSWYGSRLLHSFGYFEQLQKKKSV